jgi:hypothetical protein
MKRINGWDKKQGHQTAAGRENCFDSSTQTKET